MKRVVLGIIVGYVVWTVIWLGGNTAFFSEAAEIVQEGRPFTAPGPLAALLVLSIICSIAAGYACAWIAKTRAGSALLITALLLLATGIGVQAGVWSMMPVWYHLIFLGLLVPVTLLGGKLRKPAAA